MTISSKSRGGLFFPALGLKKMGTTHHVTRTHQSKAAYAATQQEAGHPWGMGKRGPMERWQHFSAWPMAIKEMKFNIASFHFLQGS